MCFRLESIASHSNVWIGPRRSVQELFEQCLREMDEYFAKQNMVTLKEKAAKELYQLCVAKVVQYVAKMRHTVYRWNTMATMLCQNELNKNINAMCMVRSMMYKKEAHLAYKMARRELVDMGLYDDDSSSSWEDSDDDGDIEHMHGT